LKHKANALSIGDLAITEFPKCSRRLQKEVYRTLRPDSACRHQDGFAGRLQRASDWSSITQRESNRRAGR